MEIAVDKKKFTFTDSYVISNGDKVIYTASQEALSLMPAINLFRDVKERPIMIIRKNLTMYEYSYDITRWDNNVVEFRPGEGGHVCYSEGDKYNLFMNKGRKYSIYKNDIQVAWWDKNKTSYFGANHYLITTDADAQIELIISFCLIVDNFSKDKGGGGIIATDFGHFGDESRPFDPNWKPK